MVKGQEMAKSTAKAALALKRISALMPSTATLDDSKGAILQLAHLAFIAKLTGIDVSGVRWTGSIPAAGLSGWQQDALMWLKEDVV